jgi:hypothetical protein
LWGASQESNASSDLLTSWQKSLLPSGSLWLTYTWSISCQSIFVAICAMELSVRLLSVSGHQCRSWSLHSGFCPWSRDGDRLIDLVIHSHCGTHDWQSIERTYFRFSHQWAIRLWSVSSNPSSECSLRHLRPFGSGQMILLPWCNCIRK